MPPFSLANLLKRVFVFIALPVLFLSCGSNFTSPNAGVDSSTSSVNCLSPGGQATPSPLPSSSTFYSNTFQTLSADSPRGLDVASDYAFSGYTLNAGPVWSNLMPSGYVQFVFTTTAAGTYGLSLYYSTTAIGAGADISVNGIYQSSANLPSTGSFSTFATSTPVTITLPLGQSLVQIAAQTTFNAFNLSGMTSTPILVTAPTVVSSSCLTVNKGVLHQEIDGFGASTAFEVTPLTSSQADLFFSPTVGVGLSLLRTEVPDDGSCSSVNLTCAGEISDMQLASNRGARVWSTPWSPPATMKSNSSLIAGSLSNGSYQAYANYLLNYVNSVAAQGVTLLALSVQNEPDSNVSYDSANWSAQNFHNFILDNLGPTLAANGKSAVQVVMPESSVYSRLSSYGNATLADPIAAAFVGIVAFHGYDNPASPTYEEAQALGKHYWETEMSAGTGYGPSLCGGCWDPSMADALMWGQIINSWMVNANINAWNYWWAINFSSSDNQGLIYNGTVSKRLYAMGNFSKFVRPGYYRIDTPASPPSGLAMSAYANSSTGAFAVVVINQNTSNIVQSFALNGLRASTITPWITSNSLSLIQQPSIAITKGAFNYTLPAQSITTFVGTNN
jgi:glucuronoarabinoxylan endo-1,4-beta-xylanase